MLFELNIIPVGRSSHMSREIAEALKEIDASGLPYQLTATGTSIEGEWDEIMPLIHRCHQRVRELAPHVMTTIRIEDDAEDPKTSKLKHNVTSVEEKVGHELRK